MCKYCNYDEDKAMPTLYRKSISFGLAGGAKVSVECLSDNRFYGIIYFDALDDAEEVDLKFKYCPMCGRKLEELDG